MKKTCIETYFLRYFSNTVVGTVLTFTGKWQYTGMVGAGAANMDKGGAENK